MGKRQKVTGDPGHSMESASTDGTATMDSGIDTSTSSSFEYEVVDYSSCLEENVGVLMEQTGFIPCTEEVMPKFIRPRAVVSGDLVLSFCGFLLLPDICSLVPKKVQKSLNTLVAGYRGEKISRDDVYVFYTERINNTPLEMVLDMYRGIALEDSKYIIFISKVYRCGRHEMEDVLEDFKEYSPSDLDHIPSRREEILLLSSYLSRKQVAIGSSSFRLFLLSNKMFASFVSLFEGEVDNSHRG